MIKRYLLCLGLLSPGLLAGSGCSAPMFAAPCPVPAGSTAAQQLAIQESCYGKSCTTLWDSQRLRNEVDILFVVDASPSMSSKQKLLAAAMPQFVTALDATGANYHLGVVTTDLGYNPTPTTGNTAPWNTLPSCNTYSGDDGMLQNTPCANRSLTGEALAACSTLCPDPGFMPVGGARYISKVDGVTNVPAFQMGGVDIGPQRALQCLALLGDTGCGVEQPLEAAKRALDNHRPDNQGFNRETSVLAVVFITDEDDCSVQLAQRAVLNPLTPASGSAACNTGSPSIDPQCYNVDYRCLASSLSCNEPMNTVGPKTDCKERPDSILNPIDRYVQFFASLPNPNLIIAGIWTPTLLDNPTADATKDGRLFVDYVSGTMDSAGLNRGQRVNAACYNPDPTLTTDAVKGFAGQAQLRLSTFIRRFPPSQISETSICDAGGYPKALAAVAAKINNAFTVNCLPGVPRTFAGVPECVVGHVRANNTSAAPAAALPVCSARCRCSASLS